MRYLIDDPVVNIDNIMAEEDYKTLSDYGKEKRMGKLVSHRQLKKELASKNKLKALFKEADKHKCSLNAEEIDKITDEF